MSHIMPKAVALALACALTLPLAACGGDKTNQPSPDTTPVAAATPEPVSYTHLTLPTILRV